MPTGSIVPRFRIIPREPSARREVRVLSAVAWFAVAPWIPWEGDDEKLKIGLPIAFGLGAVGLAISDPLPPDLTYRPLPTQPFSAVKENDEAQKPQVMERQRALLEERYDLADRPMPGMMMSGGRKAVQEGVRVALRRARPGKALSQNPG